MIKKFVNYDEYTNVDIAIVRIVWKELLIFISLVIQVWVHKKETILR